MAALLLWLSMRSIPDAPGASKIDFIWKTWTRSDKWFLICMALVAMISHLLRAYRWQMLIKAAGHQVSLGNSFLSLMIGYLVNLGVPRGGEITRCYNLLKLEKTPVEISFGTVVAERVVDVLCLVVLIAISFFVEWDNLIRFVNALPFIDGSSGEIFKWLLIGLVGLVGISVLIYLFRKNEKLKKIAAGFKNGLLSIFKLEHAFQFTMVSILIWLMYFVMSYFVIIAFPETQSLGLSAVLTLFAMGAIAMTAPLPGGAGSYHTIVPLGLVMLYGLPKGDAIAFVFIFHAWQTFIMIVGGVVSLVISYSILRWKR